MSGTITLKLDSMFRIHRTYEWVLAVSAGEVRYGGRNPMKLVHTDTLQYKDGDEWRDVPVVEGEQPEHPHDRREREAGEAMVAGMAKSLERARASRKPAEEKASTRKWLPFNINETVRVKLNDEAKQHLTRMHDQEMDKLRNSGCWVDAGPAFELDADGYWEVQLWKAMSLLGPLCNYGVEAFNTTIQVGIEQ